MLGKSDSRGRSRQTYICSAGTRAVTTLSGCVRRLRLSRHSQASGDLMFKSPRRLLTAGLVVPFVTFAQDVPSGSASSLEEVFVTATKQVEAVAVQDVAAAVTAYSSEDLQ